MADKERWIRIFFEELIQVPKEFVEEFERIKKSSGEIDFGCDGNSCSYFWDDKEKRCCARCNINRGHFVEGEVVTAPAEYYLERYDNELGFWRPNIGCILPREKRSHTCLVYKCDDGDIPKESKEDYNEFYDELCEIEAKIEHELDD